YRSHPYLGRLHTFTHEKARELVAHASALTQRDVTGRRSSLAKMASADWVQTKGLGLALCSARYALMAVCRSTIEWNTPRQMRCRVILEKKFSTALSQEAEVGVK